MGESSVITSRPGYNGFDPRSAASWRDHINNGQYITNDYATINYSTRAQSTITLSFDTPYQQLGWTPPAVAHVFSQNVTTGQWEVTSFPIGGYGFSQKTVSVGYHGKEFGALYVAVTGSVNIGNVPPVGGFWGKVYNAIINLTNILHHPDAYRVLANGTAVTSAEPHCFLAGTGILMADGTEKPIEHVRTGDVVLAFDPTHELGRGELIPRKVLRTFINFTDQIVNLHGLHVTPSHMFLSEKGKFERIADILARDGCYIDHEGQIVRARTGLLRDRSSNKYICPGDEDIAQIGAQLYSEESYLLRGQGVESSVLEGTDATNLRGWRTYNLEVEHLHTYIAGGVRVHNDSLQNFLNLSVMMKNDAYTAVAIDGLVQQFGWDAVGSAAWAGEAFTQAGYADHVKDMMDAYHEAIATGDFKTAEAIIGGLQEAERGAGWAMQHSKDAIAANPTSSAVKEFQDNYNRAEAGRDAIRDGFKEAGIPTGGSGGSPSGTPSGNPTGGTADPNDGVLGEPSGGANHSAGSRPGNANLNTQPVSITVGPATITRMPNGTIYSQVNSGAKQSFAQMRGEDVLALGEMETLKDGTKRETYTSALVNGGMQTTVIRYAKDGTVLSQTVKVNEVLRLKSNTLHDGTKTLDEYTGGGLLKSQIYLEPDQSGWFWEKNFKPKAGEWKTRKTYFDKKNVTTCEELTYKDGRKEVKAYSGDHVLLAGVGTLTLLKEARHGTGNNLDNLIIGNSLDNRLRGDGGQDTLNGGAGDDTLHGGEGEDLIDSGAGNDTLKGDDGADTLFGGDGSDDLDGGSGNDTLRGGNGIDELHGGAGNDHLEGEADDDMLFGDEGDDSLDGGAGRDELQGGLGNDTLNGGADRDWLVGGEGADWLSGGDGEDKLIGGAEADRLIGGEGRDTLEGGDGRDTLEGGTGDDRLRGDADDDVLHGEDGADDLNGGAGHDLLYGGVGNDAQIGETGNDTLYGGAGDDALVGEAGDDRLYGETGSDVLKGGADLDILSGDAGADFLYGGSGNDTLLGGSEDDLLYGDDGADSLDGGSGEDKLWGGVGDDTLLGGLGHDVLTGDAGADSLDGGQGDDKLSGGAGHDTLVGGGGADQLFGGDGNDILYGGPDADYIDGGAGTDTIVLTGNRTDYLIRFNTALGRYSIVDLRSGSPDGTDLADIEIFRFSDGDLTIAELNYITAADAEMAYDVESSDGSKSRIGWRPSTDDPSVIEAYVQRRNIAGELMSETVFRPDGSRLAYAWDLTGTLAWSSYVQTYDTHANLVSQVDTNRNGTFTKWEFDPAAIDAHDWRNREITYLNQDYCEAGVASRVFETIDDGKLGPVDFIERLWDLTGETWSTKVREINTTKQVLIETIVNDDGSSIMRGEDYGQDGHNYRDGMNLAQQLGWEWISFVEHRDAANNKTLETYHYYSYGQPEQRERTVERGWDFNGQDWTRYELTKDDRLRETVEERWFDNGTRSYKEWNWSGQGWAWHETLYSGSTKLTEWEQYAGKAHIYREFAGDASFATYEVRTNANGDKYYEHFDDGTRKTEHLWDLTGQYAWQEQITTTVNGVISRIETIYSNYKTVEIRDLSGAEEWTKHIQEWRGPNFQNKIEDKYYDGNKLIKELAWDFNGKDWDSTEKRYDDGTVYYHKIVYDEDDYTVVTETDTNGNDNWETTITKSREYGNTMKTFAVITKYDSAITESGITFDEFVKLTDHNDVEIWLENHIRANSNSPIYGYVVLDNGTGRNVSYVPGYLEKARAWDGLNAVF